MVVVVVDVSLWDVGSLAAQLDSNDKSMKLSRKQ